MVLSNDKKRKQISLSKSSIEKLEYLVKIKKAPYDSYVIEELIDSAYELEIKFYGKKL